MRRGEILSLTWDKIDLRGRIIRLEASDTKDREARIVPICDELHAILTNKMGRIREAGDDNHVFQFRGKPVTKFRTALRRACKKAGIQYGRSAQGGFVFHDLRHTFNTNMRKAGVPESVIMEITGHSTREMFDRYNKVDEEDTRNAAEKLQLFLATVDQNVDQTPSPEKNELAENQLTH